MSGHYEMLRKLGYKPCKIEQNELEQAGDDSIAANYNIFLMTRVHEEARRHGTRRAP